MSKRFALNLQYGERKKAKLDISVSEHHLPLSQNSSASNKDVDLENWGDDNNDEILMQISQACEEDIGANASMLPEYSMWEPPGSTSTQCQPAPSTSKTPFTFKKPSGGHPNAISTHLRNKCNTISSPLPGMANKFVPNTNGCANLTDDLIFNAKVSGQDDMYNQVVRLKEEKEKLKADNDKLLEKCVTREGEASILRTQLKSCQVAVDNARMEKTRAQENVRIEYTEKLDKLKNQMSDLQTQLEFKELEIISVKEKLKKVESGRKLTQITVLNHDISSSYRNNNHLVPYDTSQHLKKVHTVSSSAQTDAKAPFLKLNKTPREDPIKLNKTLPLAMEPTQQQQSIIDYNEALQKHSDVALNKSRAVGTIHRIPSTPGPREESKEKLTISSVYEDLAFLATEWDKLEKSQEKYFRLFGATHTVLNEVRVELEQMLRRVNTSFQKEMDERYLEASAVYVAYDTRQLAQGCELYADEQAIQARRFVAILGNCLEAPSAVDIFRKFEEHTATFLLETAIRICELIDQCSCGIHYSGLLLSLTRVFESLLYSCPAAYSSFVARGVRAITAARPLPCVSTELLSLTRRLTLTPAGLSELCSKQSHANLKLDYEQGLQLYSHESCQLQVLLQQVEAALQSAARQRLTPDVIALVNHLTALYGNLSGRGNAHADTNRCECQVMLMQGLVYALRICAVMLEEQSTDGSNISRQYNVGKSRSSKLRAACRSGVQALYQSALRHADFASRLASYRAHLGLACDKLRRLDPSDLYGNMLSELSSSFQAAPEDAPSSYHQAPWEQSFENFSLAD